jgi:hypothetical protein
MNNPMEVLMKDLNMQKVATAGLLGTLAMTILMLMAPMLGMPKMDMGNMLGPMNPIVALPYWMGWVMHFIIGTILAWLYAAYLIGYLPYDGWKRGMMFSLAPFLLKEILVSPMMGMGLFEGGDMMVIVGGLIGHLVYGGAMGYYYGEG